MLYEVPIVYRGQVTYVVEAASQKAAESLALAKWHDGETPTDTGNAWEQAEQFGVQRTTLTLLAALEAAESIADWEGPATPAYLKVWKQVRRAIDIGRKAVKP